MPGPFIPIDSIDSEPSMYRFYRRLSSFCRVIRFDHRGMGMSSRIGSADTITPSCWAEDAVTVMDAVGCERAAVLGSGFTAVSALLLAADHPDRVSNLVILNGSARALWAPDYTVGARASGANPFTTVAIEPDAVEQGFDVLSVIAPSVAGDDPFRTWWDHAGNRAASPSMARMASQVLADADVRDKLPLDHRTDPGDAPRSSHRSSPSATAGTSPTTSRGPATSNCPAPTRCTGSATPHPILDEIEEFITGKRAGSEAERVLTTIVFTDIVGSTARAATMGDDRWRDLLDNHDAPSGANSSGSAARGQHRR